MENKVVLNSRQKIVSHVIYGVLIGIQTLIFLAFTFGMITISGRGLNPISAIYYVIGIFQISGATAVKCILEFAIGITYIIMFIQMIIRLVKCIVFACNKKIGYRRVGVMETFKESYAYAIALFLITSTFAAVELSPLGYVAVFMPVAFLVAGFIGELYCHNELPSVPHVVSRIVNTVIKFVVLYMFSQYVISTYWENMVTSVIMLFATFAAGASVNVGLIFSSIAGVASIILYMVAGYSFVATTFKTICDPIATELKTTKTYGWGKLMGLAIAIVAIDFVVVVFSAFLVNPDASIDIGPQFVQWFDLIKDNLLPMLLLSIAGFVSTKLYTFPDEKAKKKILDLNSEVTDEIKNETNEEEQEEAPVVEVEEEKVESVEAPVDEKTENSDERLVKLQNLLDQGLITEEEFNKLK